MGGKVCLWCKGKTLMGVVNKVLETKSKFSLMVREHSSITSSKRWVGGVRKWQFLMIYSTVDHQWGGWMGLKKPKTWWRNTWMPPLIDTYKNWWTMPSLWKEFELTLALRFLIRVRNWKGLLVIFLRVLLFLCLLLQLSNLY